MSTIPNKWKAGIRCGCPHFAPGAEVMGALALVLKSRAGSSLFGPNVSGWLPWHNSGGLV